KNIAYICEGVVWCLAIKTGAKRQISPDASDTVFWGSAEFIAAEELCRYKGLWWSPESDQLLITRVDEAKVGVQHIPNSVDASQPPTSIRYPMAGEPNAEVTLFVFGLDAEQVAQLVWDNKKFEYLSKVSWSEAGITIKV